MVAGRFEQAIEWADRTLLDQPRFVVAMRVKVVALAHLGHLDAARAEFSRVLATAPNLTIAGFRAYARFMAPEVLELYVIGLRLAGLPESADDGTGSEVAAAEPRVVVPSRSQESRVRR